MNEDLDEAKDTGFCFFCGSDTDNFCSGCQNFICEDCEKESPFGPHDPEEHQIEAET